MIVKAGNIYPVEFTVGGIDLTGATVRLLARKVGETAVLELASTVTNAGAGVIEHTLTGNLAKGVYDVEVEVTKGGEIISYPTPQDGSPRYLRIQVVPALD